jgi:hypothetical protein
LNARIKYFTFIIALFCLSEVFSQSIRPDGIAEDSIITNTTKTTAYIDSLKSFIDKCDSALSTFGSHLLLIAELADSAATDSAGHLIPSDNVMRVENPDSWPDYTTTSLVIYRDSHGDIKAVEEAPVSESGDWYNNYTHYFDNDGRTIGFKRYSGFFIGCPTSPAKETSVYLFDGNQNLIYKDYLLTDADGNKINPRDCEVFMYRHKYSIFASVNEFVSKKHTENLVSK